MTPAWWMANITLSGCRKERGSTSHSFSVNAASPLGKLWQGNQTLTHAKNSSGKRPREWLGRIALGSFHPRRLVGLTDEGRKNNRENAEQSRTFMMTTILAMTYFYLLTKPLGNRSCSKISPGPLLLHALLSMPGFSLGRYYWVQIGIYPQLRNKIHGDCAKDQEDWGDFASFSP